MLLYIVQLSTMSAWTHTHHLTLYSIDSCSIHWCLGAHVLWCELILIVYQSHWNDILPLAISILFSGLFLSSSYASFAFLLFFAYQLRSATITCWTLDNCKKRHLDRQWLSEWVRKRCKIIQFTRWRLKSTVNFVLLMVVVNVHRLFSTSAKKENNGNISIGVSSDSVPSPNAHKTKWNKKVVQHPST